jgi:Tfp pilus assembly protein PilN
MNPVKLELQDTIGKRPQVTMVNPEASLEELSGKESEFKKKLETLNDLIKKQLYVTKPLSAIPKAIPEGAWLTRFTFEKKDKEKADLTLDGMSYLANSDEEMKTVNQFVQNLKSNPEFAKFFKNINVTSIDRRQMGKITATSFLISCKTY